jgi:hypothetical protein
MSRSAFRGSRISGVILISMIGLLVACSKPSMSGDGGTTAAGGQWLVGPPGMTPATTIDYMKNKVSFGRKAADDSAFIGPYPCPGCPNNPVTLTVVPEKQAQHISWDEAFRNDKNKGAIVAKVVNDNDYPYPPLQLNAHDSAYLWVGPITNDGTDRAVAYYKIDATAGTAVGPINPDRSVVYCDMPNWNNRTHSAAKGQHPMANRCYRVTYEPVPPYAASATKAPMSLFTNVSYTSAMFRSSGTWISCVYGCCEVGYAN